MDKKNSTLFTSILYIVVGLLLAIFPGEAISWAMTIAGIFFIVSGVLDIVKKNFTSGGISLVIGIAIIVLGWLLAAIVLLVLGILIAVKGALALWDVIKAEKKNALDFVFPAATIVVGLMLAFGNGVSLIVTIVGILLAIDGVIGVADELKAKKK